MEHPTLPSRATLLGLIPFGSRRHFVECILKVRTRGDWRGHVSVRYRIYSPKVATRNDSRSPDVPPLVDRLRHDEDPEGWGQVGQNNESTYIPKSHPVTKSQVWDLRRFSRHLEFFVRSGIYRFTQTDPQVVKYFEMSIRKCRSQLSWSIL